jgi:anaerobic dimethyl sulfoxide reductase subunit C (anchor subunit)
MPPLPPDELTAPNFVLGPHREAGSAQCRIGSIGNVEEIRNSDRNTAVLRKSPNLSLVVFTLLIQAAVGLVWVEATAAWIIDGAITIPVCIVLVLIALGLISSLTHLARPRLAPNALKNLAASWLSREVLLVQLFAVATFLIIPASMLNMPGGAVVLISTACLLAAAALFAMTRVYPLKTIPVWNSVATPLEFVGSALLLGSAAAAALMAFRTDGHLAWHARVIVAGVGILLGLTLKTMAVAPAGSALKAADQQTWYTPAAAHFNANRVWLVRMGLYLAGLSSFLIATATDEPGRVGVCLGLLCLVVGETVGRLHFYKAYRRIGL